MLLHRPLVMPGVLYSRNSNGYRASLSSSPQRRAMSGFEARVSLVLALVSQASSVSQRLLMDLASETTKYAFPRRFESSNLEEALMSVPDLETVKFKVLSRKDQYEIREVELLGLKKTRENRGFRIEENRGLLEFVAEENIEQEKL
ncbi:Heme-binding-like protein, chloroplastic [Vitis vinifera]|uniref:Heme-binding-like protein, chloroplastic n=1 Tax=Vitis vinifera TaxID=29760 RepID=A0A438EKA4_VITVI|nr:Heme-binding-like protein, chloroplastic [Vitis vinifera]